MSRVTLAIRKMFLHQQMSDLNAKNMRLSQKLMELHKYSASVARGYINLKEMAGMPISCRNLAAGFALSQFNVNNNALNRAAMTWAANNSNPRTGVSAQDQYSYFQGAVREMIDNPNLFEAKINSIPDERARNEEFMRVNFMKQMFEDAQKTEQRENAKIEQEKIKIIEDDIQQQKLVNDSRLEAVKNELQSVEQGEKEAIKRSTPQYA